MLDKKAEGSILSPQEVDLKQCLRNCLCQLLREEEIKWHQSSKARNLLEGDSNTKYFQLLANGRHRKTRIFQLQDGGENISGDDNLKTYITRYYKGFFGMPQENSFQLDETRTTDIPQVSKEENRILIEEFTEKEVKRQSFKWNIIMLRDPMVFRQSFIKHFGRLLKMT
jgi:hypothetical protein